MTVLGANTRAPQPSHSDSAGPGGRKNASLRATIKFALPGPGFSISSQEPAAVSPCAQQRAASSPVAGPCVVLPGSIHLPVFSRHPAPHPPSFGVRAKCLSQPLAQLRPLTFCPGLKEGARAAVGLPVSTPVPGRAGFSVHRTEGLRLAGGPASRAQRWLHFPGACPAHRGLAHVKI